MDKILMVQDSPLISVMLSGRLESGGFFVETALTGEDGLRLAQKARYQIILLDFKLPGMDGGEVCKILKRQDSTKDIPVVFVSAQDETALAELVKTSGADGFLVLPYEGEDLIEKIKGFINDAPGR